MIVCKVKKTFYFFKAVPGHTSWNRRTCYIVVLSPVFSLTQSSIVARRKNSATKVQISSLENFIVSLGCVARHNALMRSQVTSFRSNLKSEMAPINSFGCVSTRGGMHARVGG